MVQDMGTQVSQNRHKGQRRIVIVQPYFQQGGAELVSGWTIQALKDLAPVSVLTFEEITPEQLNRRFGTDLRSGDFEVVKTTLPVLSRTTISRFSLLKLHWLMRKCKEWPDKEALFFSTSSEMDFGRPGIQYVDFPHFAERALHDMGLFSPQQRFHRPSWLRTVYLQAGRIVSGFSEGGVKANLTLTVSNWTGEIVRKVYGVATKTIYPPVTLEFPAIPFSKREWGFVCVGRIAPSKRILEMVRILDAVRKEGFDIHFHIIGPIVDHAYLRKLKKELKDAHTWTFFEGPVNRTKLAQMLAQHRFGIHGMINEHFGIAVAEMAKAGCIVFVPNSGGQVEIVEEDDRLLYSSEEEAVSKITRLLAKEDEQALLSKEMMARGSRFSATRFTSEIREAVMEFL